MSHAAPPKRWFIRAFGIIHAAVFRLSGGRLSNSLQGDEICFLDITASSDANVRGAIHVVANPVPGLIDDLCDRATRRNLEDVVAAQCPNVNVARRIDRHG